MAKVQKNWNSKALILFGTWLWQQQEYGHALLCTHAPFWGFKIGTQLKVCWDDVIHTEDGMCRVELNLPDRNIAPRPINIYLKQSIETAYAELDIVNVGDSLYMNYKTGKPLTSSTLNRELQRFAEKFLAFIKETTDIELDYKPLKTNAFEIAWALDMVKKYNHSPAVFKLVSTFMGHRTVKDTIDLLEVQPNAITYVEFDLIKGIHGLTDTEILENKEDLFSYVFTNIVHENQEWIPIM
ncbi:MAG: hypothetical protein EOO51_00220 [Flavobacterium sp.]|nr:MAG: hypothetical protein EOO51_00220 [Flavobacterium sp.]